MLTACVRISLLTGPISELPAATVYDLLVVGAVAFAVVAFFLAAVVTVGTLLERRT